MLTHDQKDTSHTKVVRISYATVQRHGAVEARVVSVGYDLLLIDDCLFVAVNAAHAAHAGAYTTNFC